ncbi:Pyrroline-5-carboxylate reductase [Hirsutella minnesotensis 3608]|uniref:Pyrroline-5-carboxylate reductase n=1 Tax=Hirsutella minnesotensis 3608 TaxID=1043627 RepID=A0A0F7ZJ04_9HYPO|nr:Pyrroline-5-carboxylate reductase [Hirsutella minnesotensis 3608]
MLSTNHNGSSPSELTMAVLGCGTMGIAILNGVITSLSNMQAAKALETPSSSGISTPAEDLPQALPGQFIACVRSAESAQKVRTALGDHPMVKVVQNDNLAAARQAQVILLSCKPYMVNQVLGQDGMAEALRGKLLISICAGITAEHMEKAIYGENRPVSPQEGEAVTIVRAMCNTAALIRESMTVIGLTDPPLSSTTKSLVTWIFKRVGDVVYLPASTMDVSTALVGSAPAMFALMLEAAIDGAVAMGLPRADAQKMATQAMRGATGLVQAGEHPAILREKVSTPGGCTIGGLLVLEEGGVRGSVSRAIREATCVASQLGKGVQGVNGTRFN